MIVVILLHLPFGIIYENNLSHRHISAKLESFSIVFKVFF